VTGPGLHAGDNTAATTRSQSPARAPWRPEGYACRPARARARGADGLGAACGVHTLKIVIRSTRRAGLLAVALACLAAGLVLAFKLVSRDAIAGVRTPHLLGLLALFVLPVLALGALIVDRRAAARQSSRVGPPRATLGLRASARGAGRTPGAGAHAGASRARPVEPTAARDRGSRAGPPPATPGRR